MVENDTLEQGVAAYKAGDKETARQFFIETVKENPDNERAWGWMVNVCTQDQERIYCLQQVLRINPQNQQARETLGLFTGNRSEQPWPPVSSTATTEAVLPPGETLPQSITQAEAAPAQKRPWYRSTALYVILFFLFFPLLIILVLTDKEQPLWTKTVSGVVAMLLVVSVLAFAILTQLGIPLSSAITSVNSQLEAFATLPRFSFLGAVATPTATPQRAKVIATPMYELIILPAERALNYANWSIQVAQIEIKNEIGGPEQPYLPTNGRFALLYLVVTNNGSTAADFSPLDEINILDAGDNFFGDDFALATVEYNNQNSNDGISPWAPEATINAFATAKILAVYDISLQSTNYVIASPASNLAVTLKMP